MPLERTWRGLLTIAATYIAFLLFAQFGFLSQVQRDLAGPASLARVRAVMAAMGIAGLVASLGTAWLLGRLPGRHLLRAGLAAVAAVASLSLACHGFASLFAIAAAIGASLGLLTVTVAACLPDLVPSRTGLITGLATGAAYFVSNIPVLFEADPAIRAIFPAALALLALGAPASSPASGISKKPARTPALPGVLRLLVTFLVLVWLDSAAFAIVQASPALKAQTWGSAAQKLLQGSIHFVAAAGAGALLDAGLGIAVPLASWVLFAMAFPLLQHGGSFVAAAGPLYAIGISFYSTALVVMPAQSGSPRWRAGLLFGIAGWLGSALGVGMAQDLGRIPSWFLLATGAALALVWLPQMAALGITGILAVCAEAAISHPDTTAVARGRRVYIEEGCIHCHSQYVRPGTHDEAWWGPARPLDRTERPPLVGARRQGPDLLEAGNRRSEVWHEAHLRDPRLLIPASRMPSYDYLFAGDGRRGRDLVAYLASLGAGTGVDRWALTSRDPIAPPPSPPSEARGAALFASLCTPCHGAAGRGDGPLAAKVNDPYANLRKAGFHSLQGSAEPEDQALARIVRYGLPPTSMSGHEWLTSQQVADLVAYVRTLPSRKESE